MRPFKKSLAMQLLRARELLMQRFRRHLYDQGLTEQQWRVLRALAEVEWMTNQELSDRCVLHPASLSRLLPALDRRGLIRRRMGQTTPRGLVVALTPAGRELYGRIAPENDRLFDSVVDDVGPDRIDGLYAALDAFIEALPENASDRTIMLGPRPVRRSGTTSRRRTDGAAAKVTSHG